MDFNIMTASGHNNGLQMVEVTGVGGLACCASKRRKCPAESHGRGEIEKWERCLELLLVL